MRLREVVFFLPLTIIIIADFRENARWYFAQKTKSEMNFICAICRAPGPMQSALDYSRALHTKEKEKRKEKERKLVVRHRGFEPRTPALKVRCSAD